MDLSQLETFPRGGAARQLQQGGPRSSTAPSRPSAFSIRRLEEEIGEPLFDRTSRGGTLTEAGRTLESYAPADAHTCGRRPWPASRSCRAFSGAGSAIGCEREHEPVPAAAPSCWPYRKRPTRG